MYFRYLVFATCFGIALADQPKVTLFNDNDSVYAYVNNASSCTGITADPIGKAEMNQISGAYSTAKSQSTLFWPLLRLTHCLLVTSGKYGLCNTATLEAFTNGTMVFENENGNTATCTLASLDLGEQCDLVFGSSTASGAASTGLAQQSSFMTSSYPMSTSSPSSNSCQWMTSMSWSGTMRSDRTRKLFYHSLLYDSKDHVWNVLFLIPWILFHVVSLLMKYMLTSTAIWFMLPWLSSQFWPFAIRRPIQRERLASQDIQHASLLPSFSMYFLISTWSAIDLVKLPQRTNHFHLMCSCSPSRCLSLCLILVSFMEVQSGIRLIMSTFSRWLVGDERRKWGTALP